MKLKKYYDCTVKTHLGEVFSNPLKLSESHLIAKLARDNVSVFVVVLTATDESYKYMFG